MFYCENSTHAIYIRQFSGSPRTGCKHLKITRCMLSGVENGKDYELEVILDKTKYMVVSQDQNVVQRHHINLITVPVKGWKS